MKVHVNFVMDPDLLIETDSVRGNISRSRYISEALKREIAHTTNDKPPSMNVRGVGYNPNGGAVQ
ncbi:MAG TPA: hypothetical protein C5S50_02710 [Methanosarcinaceae archaeon]|nr:hypothetical protein [Methanosarcinaceae archaeon]